VHKIVKQLELLELSKQLYKQKKTGGRGTRF